MVSKGVENIGVAPFLFFFFLAKKERNGAARFSVRRFLAFRGFIWLNQHRKHGVTRVSFPAIIHGGTGWANKWIMKIKPTMVSVSTTGLHTHQRARDELTYTLWSPTSPLRGARLSLCARDYLETRAHARLSASATPAKKTHAFFPPPRDLNSANQGFRGYLALRCKC